MDTLSSLWLPIASLLALFLVAWLARRATGLAVCPVCVGVSGTWLWMLAARQGGFAVDTTLLSILLGASVVGGAQWVETRLPAARSGMSWKAVALPTGFIAAYAAVQQWWVAASVAAAVFSVLAALFLRLPGSTPGDPAAIAQLEERMKKCC